MRRLIVLTRGTGQGTSLSASTPHRGLPPAYQGKQHTVVISGATASQDPAPRCSALQPAATTSGASQVGCSFGEKPASLLLTCFPHPAGFLRQKERYQLTRTWWTPYVICWSIRDDAIRSPGTCFFLEKIYGIFIHFSYRKILSEIHNFSPRFGEKSDLKAKPFSIFQVLFRGFPGGSTPLISDNHNF
jgi:hypothetical protein